VLFNSYYLIYKVLNTKKYQNELSNIENKELNEKLNEEERKQEKEEKPKRHYHIRKTILIILFLLALLLFGGYYGQVLAVLIGIYYALKGMLKDDENIGVEE